MKIESNAGPFELSAWTDGHPNWVTLEAKTLNGEDVELKFHPKYLVDLEHAARTLKERMGHLRDVNQ